MSLRKLIVLVVAALTLPIGILTLSLSAVPAAHADDYPPTTTDVTAAGSTVVNTTNAPSGQTNQPSGKTTVAPASSASSSSPLPFTGSNSATLAWIGIALLGAGVLLVVRGRARRRSAGS